MKSPAWYKALPRWQRKILDQVFHAIAGAVIAGVVGGVALVWLPGGIAGSIGAFVGAAGGGLREFFQNVGDRNNDTAGNWLDFAVWAGASIAVGILIGGLA